jgi:hypothetical protein
MQRRKLIKFLDDEIKAVDKRIEEAKKEGADDSTTTFQAGFRSALKVIRNLTERKQIG